MKCHFCKLDLEEMNHYIEVIVNDAPIYSCGSAKAHQLPVCDSCMYEFEKARETHVSSGEPLFTIEDLYKREGGQHLNVNVVDREKLVEAMEHPERYPQLTIRVSGYAVHWNRLSREQQEDVINRTFHEDV